MEEENVEDLNPEDLEVVITDGSEEIIIRDKNQISEKDDELKTTEYFLVENEDIPDENQEAFLMVENDCENDQEEYIAVEIEDSTETVGSPKKVIEWNEICRICASGSDHFIPIFTGEGLEHELASKINTYLPLEICKDDTLPHQACYNCAATLISWHDMFKGCLDAQQRLIEVQNKINLKDQYSNGSSVDENVATVLETETINNGEQQFDANKNPKLEEAGEGVEDEENTRCVSLEDAGVFTIVTTANQETLDPLTRTEFKSEGQTESDTGAKCYEANQRRLEVAKAKVTINGMTLFKCPECPKHLSTSYNYFAHRRVHTKEKLCRCEVCGKGFTASSSLTRHIRDVHHKIKDYKCGFCERRLASRVARDEHQRTHTDERPHVCDTCGKSFRQRASLSVHKRFHSKSFLFECRLCQRGFPRKQDMERHELTHTDQRPYKCKVCSKSFRSSASAIRHRQSHDLVHKHICEICGDSFVQARYLKSHKRKLHNDE